MTVESNVEKVLRCELAYSYELATTRCSITGQYGGWQARLSAEKPEVPQGSIRNLIELRSVSPAPKDSIGQLLDHCMAEAVRNGANSISMPDEYVEIAAWLCALPDEKSDYAKRLAGALERLLETNDEPCRFDHDGACQEHYLDESGQCRVAQARDLLANYRNKFGSL
jgi:hypothetical protein